MRLYCINSSISLTLEFPSLPANSCPYFLAKKTRSPAFNSLIHPVPNVCVFFLKGIPFYGKELFTHLLNSHFCPAQDTHSIIPSHLLKLYFLWGISTHCISHTLTHFENVLTLLFSLITVMLPSIQSCIHFCTLSSLSNALKSTFCLCSYTHKWQSLPHKKKIKIKNKNWLLSFWQIKDFFHNV